MSFVMSKDKRFKVGNQMNVKQVFFQNHLTQI